MSTFIVPQQQSAMKRLRWQILILTITLIAIGILLLSQQPILEEDKTIQPTTGGIYPEALIGTFGRLNPSLDYYNPIDRDVDRLIYSGLIKFDDNGLPQGDLAESWGISQDGKVYNFSIRANAFWHDETPVSSQDIIFTIDLLRDENTPIPIDQKDFWQNIQIQQLDEKTIQFRLPEPFAPFLDYLNFGILPYHLLENVNANDLVNHPFNLNPIGSGPYSFNNQLSENGQITTLILNAFDNYYLGRPFIDQVVFRYYPDSQSALGAYQKGDVMGINQVDHTILPDVLREPELNLYTGRLPNLTLIYFNLDNPQVPFFQEAEIRRALLAGLNRQKIVDQLLNGQAIIANSPIFPGTWAYYENIEQLEYDPESALNSIKVNGYSIPAEGGFVREKEGVKFSFELVYPDFPPYPAIAQAIQQDWSKLGIEVKILPISFDDLISGYLEPRNYQAALITLNYLRSPDPDPYPFWDQAQISEGQNYAMWNDRQASEFLERARISVDYGERAKLYRNFQVRFTTEMPALPLYYPVYSYAVDQQVQNVRVGSFFDPSDRFNNIISWYILAKRPIGNIEMFTPTPVQ